MRSLYLPVGPSWLVLSKPEAAAKFTSGAEDDKHAFVDERERDGGEAAGKIWKVLEDVSFTFWDPTDLYMTDIN